MGGLRLAAGGWRVELAPTSGTPIAQWPDGTSAAVANHLGRGKVISIGTCLGLSYDDTSWESPQRSLYAKVAEAAGVTPLTHASDGVFVYRRCGEGFEVWFALNTTDGPAWVELPGEPREVIDGLGCTYEQQAGRTRVTLSPRSSWVGTIAKP